MTESLRQRAARFVDPEAWKGPLSGPMYTPRQAVSLVRADAILSEILPLIREAGEGLEPFAKAIATADETYPNPTHYDDWLNVMRHQVASEAFRSAAAIHAKIKELIDAEG